MIFILSLILGATLAGVALESFLYNIEQKENQNDSNY